MSKFSISGSGEQSLFVFVWSAVPSGSDSMALAGWAKPSTAYTTPSPTPSAFLSSPAGSALTQSTPVLFLGALFSSRTHHFHLVSPLRLFPLPGQTLLHRSRTRKIEAVFLWPLGHISHTACLNPSLVVQLISLFD